MAFPSNPSNGQKYTRGNVTYRFESRRWKIETTALAVASSGGVTVVSNNSSLPLTNNEAGDQIFTSEDNRLYIWNGSGWYSVALLNQSPNLSVSANTVSFDFSGTPVDVTLTASDPEGSSLTFSQTGANTSVATVTQSNNVFTFTPTLAGYTGFTTTFSVSDGTNVSTANVVFDFPLISASTTVTDGLHIVDVGTQLYISGSAWQSYTSDLPSYLRNTWGSITINDGDRAITVDLPARIWYLRNDAWAGISNQGEYTLYETLSSIPITSYSEPFQVYYKDVNAGTHTIDTYSAMYFITSQNGDKISVKNGSTLHPDLV